MAYTVQFSSAALKKLEKMDAKVHVRLVNWVEKNLEGCTNPRCFGKALTQNLKEYWSYRVGKYRLMAKIKDAEVLIYIVRVDKREDVYN